jgi:hypothetical protein
MRTAATISLMLLLLSCGRNKTADTKEADWHHDTDYSIEIAEVKTVLPQAGNVELIELNCVPCHSLRYIEMQPAFPYKTWEKIVDKMINSYGAPIRDTTTRREIIDYLYAIKGDKTMH